MTPDGGLTGHAGGGTDDGRADPRLAAALAAWRSAPTDAARAEVAAALLDARVLVPVAALLVATGTDTASGRAVDKETDLALMTLERPDGARAVVAFSSTDALRRWRLDARPVRVRGQVACRAAVDDGADALVLDPGDGGAYAVEGSELRAVAAGDVPVAGAAAGTAARVVGEGFDLRPLVPADAPVLAAALGPALAGVTGVLEAWLVRVELPGEPSRPGVALVLEAPAALGAAAAALLAALPAGDEADVLVLDAARRAGLVRAGAAPAWQAPRPSASVGLLGRLRRRGR